MIIITPKKEEKQTNKQKRYKWLNKAERKEP